MKLRKILVSLLCLALALFVAVGAQAQDDMTLEQLIEKNIEARGGQAAFDAVKTAKVDARMVMGQGMEAPLTFYVMEPDKMRMDIEVQGATITQAWNGETGWQIMPLMGNPDPQEMSEEETKQMKRQDFVRGLFLTHQEKGYEAEYLGVEEIEGTPAHKVKITLEEGDVVYTYLDTDYFMEFLQEFEAVNPQTGQPMQMTMAFGDFKPVNDLMMPHSMELTPVGAPSGQVITIENIEFNTDAVTDDLFEMPETAATDDASADDGQG